jgi:N-acetylglucosamine-6-phosphate deacetylase
VTHTFNAMAGIGHREPGPVLAAIDAEDVTLELILDGIHVHERVAWLLCSVAESRVAFVTDAISAAGLPDGNYGAGDRMVRVIDGKVTLADSQTIAGSTLTLDRAVQRAVERVGLSPVDAVRAATDVPAKTLGIPPPRLAPGARADLVLFDDKWSLRRVWIDGQPVGASV